MVGPELENAMLANMKRKVEKKLVEGQLKKGKKRARDSSAKEDEAPSKRKKEKKEKKKKSSKLDAQHAKIDRRSTFKDEIIALGGTEEDLELVDAVESESEIEGSADKSLDKDLLRALKKLSKELGMLNAASKYGEAPSDESTPGDDLEDEEAAVKTPKSTAKPPKESIRKHDKSGLIFSPTTEWHKVALPDIPATKHRHYHERDIIERLQKYGRELLDEDNKQYELKISSSQQAFYATVMKSGTLSDKISALTLSVQESPVHNVRALESLVGLAKKRSRAQAVEVLRALKDLCAAGSLLPSDRRLRTFVMQPGLGQIPPKSLKRWTANSPLPEPLERAHLVAWVYEDWLKATYFEIMKIIETWSTDEVVFARSTVVDYIFELLKEKPEQEENLLRLLVNKLGDKEKKIASRASYNLLQLQIPHPAMRSVILSAIESDIIFRSGQSLHAKYYAIITLNQTVLSSKQQDVVVKILDIYFTLFHSLLTKPQAVKKEVQPTITPAYNKKGQRQGGGGKPGKKALEKQQQDEDKGKAMEDQIRERILAAILTGVNRAFPYASTDHEFFDKHIDTLFLLTHSSNFNTGIQALMLIQQLCQSHPATSERFYRTLYESLLDPRVMTTSKTALYLNLIYRALKADLNINRVKAFVKRLFQIAAVHQPSFACAVLYLYRELEAIFPSLKQFIDLPEDDDSDDEVYHDVVEQDRAQNSTASEPKKKSRYDGKKRDPQWSNAEKSCLWELVCDIPNNNLMI